MTAPSARMPGEPLRVGIDGRSLTGRGRGVAVYTAGLLAALAAQRPDDRFEVLLPRDGAGDLPAPLQRENVVARRHRAPGRLLFGAAAITGRPRLDRTLPGPLDVAWLPAPVPVAVSPGVPVVLSLHDLSFEEHPADYTAYERLWHRLARPGSRARSAAAVMAVSDSTRRAAIARWSLEPDRVSVVSPGVTAPGERPAGHAVAAARLRHGLGERYLLFVGALEPRKAPRVLLAAHRRARESGLSADLALAGSGRLSGELVGPGVHVLGNLGRDELSLLYAGAIAVVVPSRSEGFGFPPLEALALGTPSVVSDLPVFTETLGDAALRAPFGDEEALAAALCEITGDPDLRERLVSAGGRALERFTWEKAAQKARAVLAGAARQ